MKTSLTLRDAARIGYRLADDAERILGVDGSRFRARARELSREAVRAERDELYTGCDLILSRVQRRKDAGRRATAKVIERALEVDGKEAG